MKDQNRIYHVVTFTDRRSPFAFTGENAARDAASKAKREGGKVKRMTGEEWSKFASR